MLFAAWLVSACYFLLILLTVNYLLLTTYGLLLSICYLPFASYCVLRVQVLLDCVRATRSRVGPSFGVAVKLNSADFQEGGFSPEEAVQVTTLLTTKGGTLPNCSHCSTVAPQ